MLCPNYTWNIDIPQQGTTYTISSSQGPNIWSFDKEFLFRRKEIHITSKYAVGDTPFFQKSHERADTDFHANNK